MSPEQASNWKPSPASVPPDRKYNVRVVVGTLADLTGLLFEFNLY